MKSKVQFKARLAMGLVFFTYSAGCGVVDGALRKPNSGDDATGDIGQTNGDAIATGGVFDLVQYPPKDYYEGLLVDSFDALDRDQVVNRFGMPQTIWLNFDGGTITQGSGQGQSFLICSTAAVVPPLGMSQVEKDAVVKKVQETFTAIGAPVTVSSMKPSIGFPTTIYIGGSTVDLGCPEAKGRQGLAPLDALNANRSDVAFVFASAASSNAHLARTILHVVGHTLGLDHVSNERDIMHSMDTNSEASFAVSPLAGGAAIQDGPFLIKQALGSPMISASSFVGSTSQVPVFIPGVGYVAGGSPAISGVGQLTLLGQLIGALGDSQVLDLNSVNSRMRSIFGFNLNQTNLAGIERSMTVLALATRAAVGNQGGKNQNPTFDDIEGNEDAVDSPSFHGGSNPGGPGSPNGQFIDGSLVSQYFMAQAGTQISLEKLASAAGYQSVETAIRAIQAGLNSGALKFPTEEGFSDVGSALNLSKSVYSYPHLVNSFWASAYIAKGSLMGLNLSAVNSTLKLAYFQHFKLLSAGSGK